MEDNERDLGVSVYEKANALLEKKMYLPLLRLEPATSRFDAHLYLHYATWLTCYVEDEFYNAAKNFLN